jgi:hypothetical protein
MTQTAAQRALDSRYGRTPDRRRRGRLIAVIAAIGVGLTVAAWVIWAGPLQPQGSIEYRDIGYSALDDEGVTVRWEITTEARADAACAVQALDGNHGVVGWEVVQIPADDLRTRQFTQRLRTSAPAVTGLINRCWLT